MGVSPELYSELAKALSQPSHAYRATQEALGIPGGFVKGYTDITTAKNAAIEGKLKPYEIYSKIAEAAGPDAANQIFKAQGIPVPVQSTSGQSMDDLKKLLKTNPNAIPPKMRSLVESSTVADATNNYRDTLHKQFQESKGMQLNNERQKIEKDFQDKADALANAEDAITSSLALKKKSGTSGPVAGGFKSVVGNLTSGAGYNDVYQLNKNNELWRSALQHAVQVNRFNPEEVGFIGGGALAQPGEPIETSVQKAATAIQTLRRQRKQLESERAARLSTIGADLAPASGGSTSEADYDPLDLLGRGNP